ncbi:MAG: hypothetical protein GY861_14580 [bacterium]|nr:hypothetical protein [bacterium]
MEKIKSITDLYEKCKSGEIDESKLEIQVDNDTTWYGIGEERILEGEGYHDVVEALQLLFPNASECDWC